MRSFLVFILTATLSVPAAAQDATPVPDTAQEAPAVDAAETPAADKRMELSARMHEIWPVSTRVEEAIDMVAENVPENDREGFKARMRKAIDKTELERQSMAAMATVYSEGELQAMVDFYGSPEGRSITAKTEDYMSLLEPIMVKMLDSALLKLRTGAPLQSTPAPAP